MKTKVALCLTALLMLCFAMNIAMAWQLTHVKESITVEMTATAANVDCRTGESVYWSVYVTSPYGTLSIPSEVGAELSPEIMQSLIGQKVHFRMKNSAAQSFAYGQHGDIVALRTDDQDIFTLDDYNRAMQAASSGGWPVWLLLEAALLALVIWLARKLRREKTASAHRV